MRRCRLLALGVVWSASLLGSSVTAQPPSAAEQPAQPSREAERSPSPPSAATPPEPGAAEPPDIDAAGDGPPPPSAAEPTDLDVDDASPPPPSAAEVDADPGELFAEADQTRAPPEPLGPPEPVPPPVPITTETVNAPPMPPDPASDPDSAFPPAPPPSVDGRPVGAPPPSATEAPAPPPVQPSTTSEPPPQAAATATSEAALFRLGALAGVGVTFDHTLGGINPLGFGFGLRGDYQLADAFRVGARTLYFVGGHSELPTGTVEMSSWLMAVEGAYTIDLSPITLEPGLALGFFERDRGGPPLFASSTAGYIPGSQHHVLTGFYLAPGISGYLPLGELDRELDLLFVGLDARFDLVFSSSVSANLQLLFEFGLRF